MDLRLKNKVALVTGSTVGIGRAIAEALAAEGATTLINGRDAARTSEAADEIASSGGSVHPAHGEVSSADGVEALLQRVSEHGPVDILVNNAGIFKPRPFDAIEDADWLRFFETNVLSGVRLSRALIPSMAKRGWGRVIFISSESAFAVPEEMVHYAMTKTAQLSVMRGLAKTVKGTGVTVNAVLPGPTWTRGVEQFVAELAEQEGLAPEEMRDQFVPKYRPSSLIQRFIEPDEVASMIAYVVSERSSATTGAALRVEGGLLDDLG